MNYDFPKNEKNFSVHAKIKKIRESLGLSQEEFGRKLDLSISAVSRIESGETINLGHTLIALLIKEYNVNINWLLLDQGEIFGDGIHEIQKNIETYNNLVAEKSQNYSSFADIEKDEEIKRLKSQIDILFKVIKELK